ncbi:odorant receptor 2a-like [Chironomus tepperi]|uniref:odorant receptor 2a-like n=1 Tax=Chironomus tepperi TaxID=113505 RepID=UPI00391F9928
MVVGHKAIKSQITSKKKMTKKFQTISNLVINLVMPTSIRPLEERTFFKIFWSSITLFGLVPRRLGTGQKYRAILLLFIFCIPTVIQLFGSVIMSTDAEDKVHGIQTIPVLLLMIFDASNFVRKSKKIEEFCGQFNAIMARYNNEKFCSSKFRSTNVYVVTSGLFLVGSITSNMVVFVLTGKSGIPTLNFGGSYGLVMSMIAQLMFMVYTGAIFLLLDAFMCSMLFLLSGYAGHLRDNFISMKIENIREIVELHLEFKNMVSSYEEIFSTVIVLRGLLNVFALSSIALEIAVNGSSGMSFNVLFFGFNGLFKLFTPCYYGSYIEHESEAIFRNLYNSAWLNYKFSDKKKLLVLQTNFGKTLKVRALNIVEINLETFVKIIQWTYSMYASLRALRNKH